MQSIFPRKPDVPADCPESTNVKPVAEIEGALRDIVRRDVKTSNSKDAPDTAANVNSLVQRASSLGELKSVIQELQRLHDFMQTEGERLEQEIADYDPSKDQHAAVIGDDFAVIRSARLRPRANEGPAFLVGLDLHLDDFRVVVREHHHSAGFTGADHIGLRALTPSDGFSARAVSHARVTAARKKIIHPCELHHTRLKISLLGGHWGYSDPGAGHDCEPRARCYSAETFAAPFAACIVRNSEGARERKTVCASYRVYVVGCRGRLDNVADLAGTGRRGVERLDSPPLLPGQALLRWYAY